MPNADQATATPDGPQESQRYEFIGSLGEGATAHVYVYRDVQLEREVAIKFLSPSAASIGIVEQARALARVANPNVVQVHEVVWLKDPSSAVLVQAIVMERVQGEELSSLLDSGGLGPAEARLVGQGLIHGLRHIHSRGVAHGDIHGENVLIATTDYRPRYIDIYYWGSLEALSTLSRGSKLAADLRALVRLLTDILHHAAPSLKNASEFDRDARRAKNIDEVERLFLKALEPEPPDTDKGGGPSDRPPEAPSPGPLDVIGRSVVSWVEEKVNRWKSLCSRLPTDHPAQMRHGRWCASYLITELSEGLSAKGLLEAMVAVTGHETGWPPWWVPTRKGIAPYPIDGEIECWLGPDGTFRKPAHADYWRAAPTGKFLLIRGYQEDAGKGFEPGTVFDLTLPIWRTAECLLHAARMGRRIGKLDALVHFRMEWTGLDGRVLKPWAEPARDLLDEYRARTDRIITETRRPIGQLESELVAAVHDLVKPLYECFDFFELPPGMIEQELEKLRLRRF